MLDHRDQQLLVELAAYQLLVEPAVPLQHLETEQRLVLVQQLELQRQEQERQPQKRLLPPQQEQQQGRQQQAELVCY